MRFDYSIKHVPWKGLWTADALSRSPMEPPEKMEEELEAYVQLVRLMFSYGPLPGEGAGCTEQRSGVL